MNMSEILREKQKAEALKRMRLMGLREDFIRDFEEDGKVHICTFQKTFPEPSAEDTEMVRQFEQKHHALVYLILRVHTILGDWTPCSMWGSTPRNGRWIWPI